MAREEIRIARDRSPLRMIGTPYASIAIGSLTTALPMIAQAPLLPPFGLLMLLGWRLLRPELLPVWAGIPLGLFDDIMSGQPIGSAMFLWTMVLLVTELAHLRLVWRDYWEDWVVAILSILFCIGGGMLFVRLTGGGGSPLLILPQITVSILLYPPIARFCAMLDRWRLP